MSYSYATGGSGWQMVPCMVTFLAEVEACVAAGQLDVTNLGQIGDARHQAEPTSRHNPAQAPNGEWYVCAADFGGKDYAKLAEFHRSCWNARDPRVYRYGFSQRGDGYGLNWDSGNWKWTGRDQGHCHFDVTMRDGSLGRDWWVDSLASTAPWGLADWLRTGQLTTSGGNATPIEEEDMPLTDDDAKKVATEVVLQLRQQFAPTGELFGRIKQAVVSAFVGLFSGPGKVGFDRLRQSVGMVMDRREQAVEAQALADAETAKIDAA